MKFTRKGFGVLAAVASVAVLCTAHAPSAQAAPGQAWLEVVTPVASITVGEKVAVSTYITRQDNTSNGQAKPQSPDNQNPTELVAVVAQNKPSSSTPPKAPESPERASTINPHTSKSNKTSTSRNAVATNTNAVNNSFSSAVQSAQTTAASPTAYDRRLIDTINANTHLGATNASTARRLNWVMLAIPLALLARAVWKTAKLHQPKGLLQR